MEQSSRWRSASLNSMCQNDFRTMNPSDKFTTPRAPPPIPGVAEVRVGSSPPLKYKRSARSLSPAHHRSWNPRRLFSRKSSPSSQNSDRSRHADEDRACLSRPLGDRSLRSSDGPRSRDISPESLRRFLCDEQQQQPEEVSEVPESNEPPSLFIPEDIVEENEDDLNFATSAVSETAPRTALSPPPFRRGLSSSSTVLHRPTVQTPRPATSQAYCPQAPARTPPLPPTMLPTMLRTGTVDADLVSHFSVSDVSSPASPTSPQSVASHDLPSFYHSEDEDDEEEENPSSIEEDAFLSPPAFSPITFTSTSTFISAAAAAAGHRPYSVTQNQAAAFSGYSLPRTSIDAGGKAAAAPHSTMAPPQNHHQGGAFLGSPALVARNDAGLPVGNTSLLAAPIGSGLDDFVSELGWMADVIGGRKD